MNVNIQQNKIVDLDLQYEFKISFFYYIHMNYI